MKKQIWKVALYTVLLKFFLGPVRIYLDEFNFQDAFGDFYSEPWRCLLQYNFYFIIVLWSVGVYLLLFYLYPKRKISLLIGSMLLLSVFMISYRYLFEEVILFQIFERNNYNPNVKLHYYFLDNIYYGVLYGFVGFVVYFMESSVYNERLKNEYLLEKEKAELSMLKSQINPHFLFNSLNNIYSLVYNKSAHALDAVAKLSSMLRYSVYENEEFIQIGKELNYINDFIELEKFRYAKEPNVEIRIEQKDILIAPFLLIPFVENAFKHGDLSDEKHPVKIHLSYEGNDLIFKVRNNIKVKEKDEVGGVGVNNVKKRLAYIYKDKHNLDIKESEEFYEVNLRINDIC